MPNHVSSICRITGPADDIARFRAECIRSDHEDGRETLDFNAVAPMPAILRGTVEGSWAEQGAEALLIVGGKTPVHGSLIWRRIAEATTIFNGQSDATIARQWLDAHPEGEAEGKARLAAIEETGFASWYDWSIATWGTKWNAYGYGEADPGFKCDFAFEFQSAWDFPEPIFRKLAERYPALIFDIVAFDEGWNFALIGQFNGEDDFRDVEATAALYEAVYGSPPEPFDEDTDPQAASA